MGRNGNRLTPLGVAVPSRRSKANDLAGPSRRRGAPLRDAPRDRTCHPQLPSPAVLLKADASLSPIALLLNVESTELLSAQYESPDGG